MVSSVHARARPSAARNGDLLTWWLLAIPLAVLADWLFDEDNRESLSAW